jgi:hypothetical protein
MHVLERRVAGSKIPCVLNNLRKRFAFMTLLKRSRSTCRAKTARLDAAFAVAH